MHIALVQNGLAREFKKEHLNNLVIYDDVDGKPRYIFDFSKLIPEFEAIHPERAIDDANTAQVFMDKLKSGEVNRTLDESKLFFDSEQNITNQEIMKNFVNMQSMVSSSFSASQANMETIQVKLEVQEKIIEGALKIITMLATSQTNLTNTVQNLNATLVQTVLPLVLAIQKDMQEKSKQEPVKDETDKADYIG
jgi:hypothetical protein